MTLLVLLLLGVFVWWAIGGLRLPPPRANGTATGPDGHARTGGVPGGAVDAARDGAALADLRAARAAGAREGFQAGLKQGRAEGFAEAMRQAEAPGRGRGPDVVSAGARPRTRAEALRVLDLPATATLEQVEERYRQLRRSAHPDNFPATKYPRAFTELAEAEFKRLGEARDLLVR
jgi:hypothetical protein